MYQRYVKKVYLAVKDVIVRLFFKRAEHTRRQASGKNTVHFICCVEGEPIGIMTVDSKKPAGTVYEVSDIQLRNKTLRLFSEAGIKPLQA